MKKEAYFATAENWPGRAGSDPSADDLREASDLQLSGNSGI